jgi:hypothetical protein
MRTRKTVWGLGCVTAGIGGFICVALAAEPAAERIEVARPTPASMTVRVDAQRVIRKMAGGMGASWHAITATEPDGPRGSAWGGNPPLDNAVAWDQVRGFASWLGMDFIRVEVDQVMYEAKQDVFTFDNESMRTLYRILDWAQANHADVFLSQMWSGVTWNFIDQPTKGNPADLPYFSAPRDLTVWANGLATLVNHLVNVKRYTCIKWLSVVNEPGNYWWKGGANLIDGLKAVRAALDARGLSVPLSGPDGGQLEAKDGGLSQFTNDGSRDDQFATIGGAYSVHHYGGGGDATQFGLEKWVPWAHARGKPFFLTEMGDMTLPWGGASPGPRSYAAALSVAQMVLQGLNAGVDGFNRWSFLNRGDLDGQWQLVRTFDMQKRRHLDRAVPELVPYMGYAMLTRFASKYSYILEAKVTGSPGNQTVASALRSPAGNVTIFLLNPTDADCEATLIVDGLKTPLTLHPYAVSESALAKPDFVLAPGAPLTISQQSSRSVLRLPPFSITTLSTFRLQPADPGVTEDVPQ